MTSHRAISERVGRRWRWSRRQRHGLEFYLDPYLDWMDFANAGMLHRGQRVIIDRAVRSLPSDDPIIEIGAFCGLSTNVLGYFVDLHQRSNRLISTDPWIFEGEDGETLHGSDILFAEYRELVQSQFIRNVRFWSRDRLPQCAPLSSDDFFVAWAERRPAANILGGEIELGGPIAMAFIDGGHAYEQARRDFENVDRWLVPGGYVLLDDTDEFGAFPHLYELVRELIRRGEYELVGANPHHLLRKTRTRGKAGR